MRTKMVSSSVHKPKSLLILIMLYIAILINITPVSTQAQQYKLTINVYNVQGSQLPSSGGIIGVRIFDYNWNYVTESRVTYVGGQSYVSLSFYLSPGKYRYVVYHRPNISILGDEFWGGYQGGILDLNKDTTIDHYRRAPYITWAYPGANSRLAPGVITFKARVRNPESYAISTIVELKIYDYKYNMIYDRMSGIKSIPANSESDLDLPPTYLSDGAYIFVYKVISSYGYSVVTDQYVAIVWIGSATETPTPPSTPITETTTVTIPVTTTSVIPVTSTTTTTITYTRELTTPITSTQAIYTTIPVTEVYTTTTIIPTTRTTTSVIPVTSTTTITIPTYKTTITETETQFTTTTSTQIVRSTITLTTTTEHILERGEIAFTVAAVLIVMSIVVAKTMAKRG